MRLKLTEIISTIDQFNGMGEYIDKNKDGEAASIETNMSNPPKEANIYESHQELIKNMLKEKCIRNAGKTSPLDHPDSNVMSFERFLKEQKGTPSNVQSYFGCLDDEEDLEEEE